jgi:hypothetical protein
MTFEDEEGAKIEEKAIEEIKKIPPKLQATLQTTNFSGMSLSDLNDIIGECKKAGIDLGALNRRQPENWKGPDDPGFKIVVAMVRQSWLRWGGGGGGGVKLKRHETPDFDAKEPKPIKRMPIHRRI